VDLGIRGKVALVTGGARSLGKADCLALAAEGCKVAVLDLDPEGADLVAKQILADGGAARGYGCDIRDTGQVTEAVAAMERDSGPSTSASTTRASSTRSASSRTCATRTGS